MAWNKELLLTQLQKSDQSVTWGLIRLWERQAFSDGDAKICGSLAEQAVWRKREIERGDRAADCPLLSFRQIALARTLLPTYWPQLVEIANARRPELAGRASICYGFGELPSNFCWRCGERAAYEYDDILACVTCAPIIERTRLRYPYELSEDDRERLMEELDLQRGNKATATRVETEALVIEGRKIRFKTPREFARQYAEERHGMPRELAAALAETNMKPNEDIPASELLGTDDPFDFE